MYGFKAIHVHVHVHVHVHMCMCMYGFLVVFSEGFLKGRV
jgi:hypothetical protein